jgi:hypothetical protein
MTAHTHIATELPYNGNNPNNCDCCGVSSATFKFTPVDSFGTTVNLCPTCRTSPVYGTYNAYIHYSITPDMLKINVERLCWANPNLKFPHII